MREYDIRELVDFVPLTEGGVAIVPKRAPDSPPKHPACPLCGRSDNHKHTAGPWGMS